jgi:hypothetical protein
MKVTLDFSHNSCLVEKEDGDPRFKSSNWALAESTFLYYVLQEIKKQGYDVIKKRMWKDGNMVDDTQQWIRTRSWFGKGNEFCIFNNKYAIEDAGESFNKNGKFELVLWKYEDL